jgi:hypothetical protein
MRSHIASILLGLASFQIAQSAEVEFQLETDPMVTLEHDVNVEPAKFVFVNREWGLTGIEAETSRCQPTRSGASTDATFNCRLERGELYSVSYRVKWPRFELVVEDTHWLEDEVWPRTREEFRDGGGLNDICESGYDGFVF